MIYNYELIKPVTNKNKPYVDKHKVFIIPNIKIKYRYYIECRVYNSKNYCYEYYLLLGKSKFDEHCRKCNVDNYGRLKIILHGELKDYVVDECNANGNINITYMESKPAFDLWKIE